MPIGRAVLSMSVPMIISQAITVIYNIADTFFVGQMNQPDQVAAITVALPLSYFLTALTNLYGMSAQLKIMIDRFCAFNSSIQRKRMKSALLTVAWNSDNWTFDALQAHYQTLVRYLNLEDMGMVLGRGCGSLAMTRQSRFPKQAYELGRGIR